MLRFLALAVLLLQDPVEIKVRPAQGEKVEATSKWTYAFRGALGDEPLNTSSRGGLRIVAEMAKVDGGALTKKVVKVEDAYVETQDVKTGKFIRKDGAIHGRTVTIERKGDKEERSGVDCLPEAELTALTLDDPLTRLFPDKPVKVGDTWEIADEGLKRVFKLGEFTKGTIVVSLRDVREWEGRRCAFLGTVYNVEGTGTDGVERKLTLQGTMTVWLDRGYVLAMSQSGRLTTKGADPKTLQPNGEAVVTGELKTIVLEK